MTAARSGQRVRTVRAFTLDDWRADLARGARGVVVYELPADHRFDMVVDFGPDHPRVSVYADEVEPFNG